MITLKSSCLKKESDGGRKAFWLYTPIKSLDGDDLDLRLLMNSLCDYSRNMNFCKQLRKTDKIYLQFQQLELSV